MRTVFLLLLVSIYLHYLKSVYTQQYISYIFMKKNVGVRMWLSESLLAQMDSHVSVSLLPGQLWLHG